MDRINNSEENEFNLTSLFLGELENSDKVDFEKMLDDSPEMMEEFDSISEIAGLLSEGLDNEWKAQNIAFNDEADVTSYALNELDKAGLAEFEAKMHKSSDLQKEVEEIRSFTDGLNRQLESEWTAHHPVDIDNLVFTDLVAGELNGFDEAQAQALINSSSITKKEADATQDMMELLSASLTDEWQSELSPETTFSIVENEEQVEEPTAIEEEEETVVVKHSFNKEQRPARLRTPLLMSAAAAMAGLLAVGAMMVGSGDSSSNVAQVEAERTITPTETVSSGVWKYASSTAAGDDTSFKIPTLMLVDEVADSLESIEVASVEKSPYDYSNGSIQPAGFVGNNVETEQLSGYKFDQLPPIEQGNITYSVNSNDQNHRSILMSDRREHNGLQSVYVQGLFTFPEGTDFDVNTVFEPKKVEAMYNELQRVKSELEATIKALESDDVNIPELRRKLSSSLEYYNELESQIISK